MRKWLKKKDKIREKKNIKRKNSEAVSYFICYRICVDVSRKGRNNSFFDVHRFVRTNRMRKKCTVLCPHSTIIGFSRNCYELRIWSVKMMHLRDKMSKLKMFLLHFTGNEYTINSIICSHRNAEKYAAIATRSITFSPLKMQTHAMHCIINSSWMYQNCFFFFSFFRVERCREPQGNIRSEKTEICSRFAVVFYLVFFSFTFLVTIYPLGFTTNFLECHCSLKIASFFQINRTHNTWHWNGCICEWCACVCVCCGDSVLFNEL